MVSEPGLANPSLPHLKDVLATALNQMQDQNGTKAEILAMAKTLYPKIEQDLILQRSLENAFSKYLEAAPVKIMLLHVTEQEEENMAFQVKSRLKRDVVECLRSTVSGALDYDTLKEMIFARHFTDAPASSVISTNAEAGSEKDKLSSRLVKLINRNSHMFSKCAKTYQLKGQTGGMPSKMR